MQFKSYLNRDIGLIFAVSFLLSLIPTAFADAQIDDDVLRNYLTRNPLGYLSYTDSRTNCLFEDGDKLLTVSGSVPQEDIPYIEYYLRDFQNSENHIPLVVQNIHYGMCSGGPTEDFATPGVCPPNWRQKCIPYTGPYLDDFPCSDDKTMILKQTDSSHACVKPSTSQKLVERGWAVDFGIIHGDAVHTIHEIPIIDGSNQFAMDFYSDISQESKDNIFFSPWSIYNAFAILYEGAAGNTADEIGNTFDFPADYTKRTDQFKHIIDDLNPDDSKYQLSVANALWLDNSFVPYPEYARTVNDYYNAEARTVDFQTDGPSIVNDWVKEKTNEKITEILSSDPDPYLKLVITNAIYFKGMWISPFKDHLTQDDDFWITPTESIKTPMMHNPMYFAFVAHLDDLSIIKMPYKGDRISMLILLPDDKDGLDSLEKSLTVESLFKWKNLFYPAFLDVKIPKFEVDAEYDLKETLQKLGINEAFEFTEADLSGIASNDGLHVSQAIHKTFVVVNEKGTEAGATSRNSNRDTSNKDTSVFHADRPFIFIISDDKTDNILFMGRITNPQ